MVGAILVAADADLALRGRGIFVAAVAGRAPPVLRLGVQTWQLLNLMTGRAGRHARNALWSVGTMAGLTTAAELAVGASLLRAVAVSANLLRRKPAVRLVTIRAGLVPLGRRLLLAAMAVGTGRCLRSGMRFVAAGAACVPRLD